ncbi:hypothetical protein K490DRAFT_72295 [Saccharata proteae CBS 121410]|uniref:Rab-GAP TBC domain-containing protein n=1 Tax=Saccharata proteae CBS 121410 TaxID=1314787 RepID=A0A6A5YDG8_9PEZI|nr:hypothetical protein K490DRAFT_72295 [Saccharata proteae CBS 121410]
MHPSDSPPTSAPSDKAARISEACRDANLDAVIELATSNGGLLDDRLRREAWPILLGSANGRDRHHVDWTQLEPHPDEEQVKLDVNRSFVYYPNDQSKEELQTRKHELFELIAQVLRRHPRLCYFQGYHDIVQVLLLVLGLERAAPAVARLSLLRIRDFMLPSLDASMSHLELLPAILYAVDPVLCKHLSPTQPYFALAATITMYAHDIQEYGDIARLFDFLLAREAVISIYLFAVIILSRKEELMDIAQEDADMLHFTLSKMPSPLNLEALISRTVEIFAAHPPETLPFRAWRPISPYSVLRTTRDSTNLSKQSLEDGEVLFAKQEVQLRRAKMIQAVIKGTKYRLWKYRRPMRGLGLAVAIGVLAWRVSAAAPGHDWSSLVA